MAKEKASRSFDTTRQIRGYSVQIVREGETEELWIDGARQEFLKTEEGYRIAYVPPKDSLLEAVKSYLELLPEKK